MTFLTFLRVTHVLCNFRLVLEGKAGEEIPESSRLKFLEKFLANHCALSDAGDDTSKPLNRGSIADLPLLIILIAIRQISWELSFWEVMDSFVLVAYASLDQTITSLSELYLRFRRFILLVQTKNVISMNYVSSTSSWKPWSWVRFVLMLTVGDICINSNLNPLIKFTSSRRSVEFKNIILWNVCQMITKTVRISTRRVISNAIKWDIPFWVCWNVNANWDNNIRIS